ncbi:RNA methyltransferase [Eggerthellaceae bacterium zg-893]|nr:RNA methyltransferase [Eggerthellaceae bacterium zg-893]
MPVMPLRDVNDPRLAPFTSMTDAELRDPRQLVGLARAVCAHEDPERLSEGLLVAESINVAARALDAGLMPFSLLIEKRWADGAAELIDRVQAVAPDAPVFVADHDAVCTVTGLARMRGLLAAFHRPPLPDASALLAGARRVAVLEDVTNHTNVGAIFRSAAALGIDAVFVTPGCHDPFYRRASRVSMGTVFQVPWTRIGVQEGWPEGGIGLLRAHGFATAALALSDDALPVQDRRLRNCDKLALILGTEGDGLAARTIAACDWCVRIPMDHGVDSLNVAAASAVAFWEVRTRHRD